MLEEKSKTKSVKEYENTNITTLEGYKVVGSTNENLSQIPANVEHLGGNFYMISI